MSNDIMDIEKPEKIIKNYLLKIIKKSFDIPLEEVLINDFSTPPDSALGDYAFGCFNLARILKKSPIEIAQEVVENIQQDHIIQKAQNSGPYINFTLQPEYFSKLVLGNSVVFEHEARNQKIMLEYSGPNPCKTFHVGHFRNTILGSAMINLYRYLGYEVIPVNYLNDTGTHVSKVIWNYLRAYAGKEPQQHKGRWLGDLYVEANQLLRDNKDLLEEVYEIHRKLEAKDSEVIALLSQFREWSKEEFDQIYTQLKAEFAIDFYDSEYILDGKKVVDELLEKGIAQKSDGAVIVDLEQYGLNVALILKSDGTALYMTKDLAMAQDRFKKYDVDRLVYVVGAEQILHFKQIFKILELNGFEQAQDCFHLAYELVNAASGKKMSTREGTVVLYHEVFEQAYSLALDETTKRHDSWSEEKITQTAEKIALCALKFDMLKQDAQKKINFDVQKSLDISGDTGPYVLYTMARLGSIIQKASAYTTGHLDYTLLQLPEEREILQKLLSFDSVLTQAGTINKPSLVAHYLLELARLVNHYYHTTTILTDTEIDLQNIRIELLKQVVNVFENGFSMLNIQWVEEM